MGKPRARVLTFELLESRSLPSVSFAAAHMPSQPLPGNISPALARHSHEQTLVDRSGTGQNTTPAAPSDSAGTGMGGCGPDPAPGDSTGQDQGLSTFQGKDGSDTQ